MGQTDTEADDSRVAPFGWEVEYLTSLSSLKDDNSANVHKTNHPGAEVVRIEATMTGSQSHPTLILYDAEGEEIALYNSTAWVACRRNARAPSNGDSSARIGAEIPTRAGGTR